MKSQLFQILAIAAALVYAGPVAHRAAKRELGGILICEGANATGRCEYNVYQMGTCYKLTAPWYENTNTFAPDGEGFQCYPRVYDCGGICTSPTGCTFGAVDFNYEHKYNLSAIGWNTLFRSFDCMTTAPTTTSAAPTPSSTASDDAAAACAGS